MKKLLGAQLLSNLSNTAGAVSSAAARQLERTLGEKPLLPPSSSPPPAEKQYLRLPVDSAKKLRWYDKGDVASLTRQHLREKHLLLDTVTALKKIMIRAGFTDAALDDECRMLLDTLEMQQRVDAGVDGVLLLSLQDEMDDVLQREAAAQRQVATLQGRVQELEGQLAGAQHQPHPPPDSSQQQSEQQQPQQQGSRSSWTLDDPADLQVSSQPGSSQPEGQDTTWQQLQGEQSAAQDAEQAAAASGQQQQPAPELESPADGSSAVEGGSAEPATQQEGSEAAAQEDTSPEAQLAALQAELEQARAVAAAARQQAAASSSRLQQVEAQLAAATSEAAAAAREASARAAADAQQLEALKEALAKANAASSSNSSSSSSGGSGSGPQPADVLRRYKDLALQMEERALAAERRAGLAEARVGALEQQLAAAQEAARKAAARAEADVAAARAEVLRLESSLCAAQEGAASSATSAAAAAQLAEVDAQRASLARQLAAAHAQVEATEERLAAAESREAALQAELATAEAAAAEREAAAAAAAGLREALAEARRERGAAEQYRRLVSGLEEGKARVEAELLSTAQLVTRLEEAVRTERGRAEAAATAAEVAAGRAAAAEAAVAAEVEARLAAVGSNRGLWPAGAREELERLEQKGEALGSTLNVLRGELDKEAAAHSTEATARAEAQRRLAEAEERAAKVERAAALKQRELEVLLDYAQKDADALRGIVAHLEVERDEALAAASAAANSGGAAAAAWRNRLSGQRSLSRAGSSSIVVVPDGLGSTGAGSRLQRAGSNASVGSPRGKWQVQNKVGGGSLYGVADEAPPLSRAHSSSSGGPPATGVVGGVDLVYLRNVLLKFLEAVMAGKVAERDALLPAVATLVGASPAEYAAMRKVLSATAPASAQVWSLLGLSGK